MTAPKKLSLIAVLLLGFVSIRIEAATHTNLIYNVSLSMSVAEQEFIPLSTNIFFFGIHHGRFTSADVANLIVNSSAYRTNNLRGAKLLFRVADLGTNRTAQFILRKGTNDVNVETFITLSIPQTAVTSKSPGANNTTNATDYTTLELDIPGGTSGGWFDATGFCLVKNTSVFKGQQLIQAEEFPATITANIAGMGSSGGKKALFRGTLLLSGRRVEIKED